MSGAYPPPPPPPGEANPLPPSSLPAPPGGFQPMQPMQPPTWAPPAPPLPPQAPEQGVPAPPWLRGREDAVAPPLPSDPPPLPPAPPIPPQPPAPPEPSESKGERKSRWERTEEESGEKRHPRKCRWGAEDEKAPLPPSVASLPPVQAELFALRFQLEEFNRKLTNNDFDLEGRSPSPEPVYDGHGKRLNTRELRARDKLLRDRARVIQDLMSRDPDFRPPADYNARDFKLTWKKPIPLAKYPEYNFIGLIIGPRGNTQKRMERETGAKIAIRGKGSVKDGKSGRRDGRPDPSENEPLHVLVTADSEEQLQKAIAMVEPLLTPVDDDFNEHKRHQLRELAAINGTLRDNEFCRNCGEPGHRIWNCPQRSGGSWKPADVACTICGSRTHPTQDCPDKGTAPTRNPKMDAEYDNFMRELSGAPPRQETTYDDFMKSVGGGGAGAGTGQGHYGPAGGGGGGGAAAAGGGGGGGGGGAEVPPWERRGPSGGGGGGHAPWDRQGQGYAQPGYGPQSGAPAYGAGGGWAASGASWQQPQSYGYGYPPHM